MEDMVKPLTENTYIRVFGQVRDINNKRMVAAFRVDPVTDMNALTSHILEIIYSRLHYSKVQDEVRVNLYISLHRSLCPLCRSVPL